jgi:hypothetical protein
MRAERAVEPTRSENITVTWRRSAKSGGRGDGICRSRPTDSRRCVFLDVVQIGNRTQELAAMTERHHPDLFEILIVQITQNRKIDVILTKALRILLNAEPFEPVRNLLHRGHQRSSCALTSLGCREFIPTSPASHVIY